jgi:hypothetical protein
LNYLNDEDEVVKESINEQEKLKITIAVIIIVIK